MKGLPEEVAEKPGLATFAKYVLGKDLPKDAQMSKWFVRPLTDRQVTGFKYANNTQPHKFRFATQRWMWP